MSLHFFALVLPPLSILHLPSGLLQQNTTDLSAQLGTMIPLAGAEALLCRRPACSLGPDWTGSAVIFSVPRQNTRRGHWEFLQGSWLAGRDSDERTM